MFKKITTTLFTIYLLAIPVFSFAQNYTLIPQGNANFVKTPVFCNSLMDVFYQIYFTQPETANSSGNGGIGKYNSLVRFEKASNCTLQNLKTNAAVNQLVNLDTAFRNCTGNEQQSANQDGLNSQDIISCAFISGQFDLILVKPLLQYILKLLSVAVGTISMLFIILGGYKYFAGVITGDVTDAKGTIKNAILGLIVATCSWIIVDLIVTLLLRGE